MINYGIIGGVILLAIVLVAWLIIKNKKDKEEFEQQMKDDYKKPEDAENEM